MIYHLTLNGLLVKLEDGTSAFTLSIIEVLSDDIEFEVAEKLLETGAVVNVKAENGNTPLPSNILNIIFVKFAIQRGVSSVGSERMLDRHEVTGSIPVHPTADNEGVRDNLAPFVFYSDETGVKQSKNLICQYR